MKTSPRISVAELAGRALGRVWRRIARQEARLVQWAVGRGMKAQVARVLPWTVKLTVLGILLYGAFWLALLALSLIAVTWIGRNVDIRADAGKWADDDHKASVFYDPINYTDDPDPRFDGE